jgi:8-oxo-dGTP diphosphatase
MSQAQVIAAIIERSGRFLLGKRSLSKKSAPGFWCTITGGIEPGETEQQAVVREVREETGLEVLPIQKVAETDTRDGTARIHWWRVEIVAGNAALMNEEHTELGWFTVEEMRKLEPSFEEDTAIIAGCADYTNVRDLPR